MEDFIKNITTLISTYAVDIIWKIIAALLVFIIGRVIVKAFKKAFDKSKAAEKMHETARSFISSVISFVLNCVLLLTVAAILGVPMTSIIALLGSAGLAVGLALQGGLSNFAGGVIILVFKPFEVGDYIVSAGVEGTVQKISIFYTTLVTPDNRRIVVPNSTVSGSTVENVAVEGERRVDVEISVDPSSDINRALEVLRTEAAVDSRVIDREAPFSAVTGYGAGCLVLALRVWCKSDDYWGLKFDLTKKIPEIFAENGIKVARPVIDVTTK